MGLTQNELKHLTYERLFKELLDNSFQCGMVFRQLIIDILSDSFGEIFNGDIKVFTNANKEEFKITIRFDSGNDKKHYIRDKYIWIKRIKIVFKNPNKHINALEYYKYINIYTNCIFRKLNFPFNNEQFKYSTDDKDWKQLELNTLLKSEAKQLKKNSVHFIEVTPNLLDTKITSILNFFKNKDILRAYTKEFPFRYILNINCASQMKYKNFRFNMINNLIFDKDATQIIKDIKERNENIKSIDYYNQPIFNDFFFKYLFSYMNFVTFQ